MNEARPSVRQLEYLVALAETLNFGRAAERCLVSQPALSTQIRTLEQLLGAPLFERDRRRVLPTATGLRAAGQARDVLQRIDALVEGARHSHPLSGELRLGVIPTIAPYVLPRVVPRLTRRFPDLRLQLREDETARLVEQLERGTLDLLLVALEAPLGANQTLELYRDSFVLIAPQDHRLAVQRTVRETDLAGRDLLLLEEGH